jgi:hypothetical protein
MIPNQPLSLDNNNWTSLQGSAVFYDLDHFGACMRKMNWSRYVSNPITAYMSYKTLEFISQYHAFHVWGLNEHEGTEEALLIIMQSSDTLLSLLEAFQKEIMQLAFDLNAPTSLSIGVAEGNIEVGCLKPIYRHNNRDFLQHPLYKMALNALKSAKKHGGNRIFIF